MSKVWGVVLSWGKRRVLEMWKGVLMPGSPARLGLLAYSVVEVGRGGKIGLSNAKGVRLKLSHTVPNKAIQRTYASGLLPACSAADGRR